MEIKDVLEIIVLPCLGWLFIQNSKVQKTLTRLETKLNVIFGDDETTLTMREKFHGATHGKKHKNDG